MKKKLFVLSAVAFAPFLAFAQNGPVTGATPTVCSSGNISTLQGLLCKFSELLNAVLPVLVALAVLYFVWGVVQYVVSSDEEAKKKGRDRIVFGVIGLVVIIGVWGLVNIVRNTFGLGNNTTITYPTVPY